MKSIRKANSKLDIVGTIVFYLFAGFSTAFTPFTILSFFGIIEQERLKSPLFFAIYIETALVAGLTRGIFWLIKNIQDNKPNNITLTNNEKEDNYANAIVGIITQAYTQGRYAEVIYIGNAVSDYLWYCGKKEQRLQIAGYVLDAAKEEDDYYTQARVLIEDLGNTSIGGNVTETWEAIKQINDGIEIAEQNKYGYLIARGYRNLACAYIYLFSIEQKKKPERLTTAETSIRKGKEAINTIIGPWERTDAEASLCYAAYRLYQHKDDAENAKKSLLDAKSLYEDCSQKDGRQSIIKERLKKIYRELGALYVTPEPNDEFCSSEEEKKEKEKIRKEGFELLRKAINMCEADNDLPNLSRTAIVLLKNAHGDEYKKYAKPVECKCRKILPHLSDRDKNTSILKELLSKDGKTNNEDN